ncbi:MAG: hypothetical protein ACREFW_05270 [Rhizomicrobium sp.]
MDDPHQGPGPVSRFRVIGLVIFALLILGFYAYTTPNSIAHAYLTGECFKQPLPDACRPRSERVVVPPDLLSPQK